MNESCYQVFKNYRFQDFKEEVLTLLYQPMLEPFDLILYRFLLVLPEENNFLHEAMFSFLSCSQEEFLIARSHLEAMGLLKTYQEEEGKNYRYELFSPLSAKQFFADDILSFLLFHKIGEYSFQRLKNYFLPKKEFTGYQEITKRFDEVYEFSEQQFQEAQPYLYQESTPCVEPLFKTTKEDDQWFQQWLELLPEMEVDLSSVQRERKRILFLHRSFQFSDFYWVELIKASCDPMDGVLDGEKLQKLVLQLQQEGKKEPQEVKDSIPIPKMKDQRLQKMFEIAKQLKPLEFLASIKKQTHGSIITTEKFAITDLLQQEIHPFLINIVLYYLLIVEKEPELPRNRFERIINQLGKHQYTNVLEIWQALPNLDPKHKKTMAKKASYTKNKEEKKVIRPEWEEKEKKPIQEASEEEKADLLAQLEALRNKK